MDELLGLGYASGLNGEVPLNGILSGALAMPKAPAGAHGLKIISSGYNGIIL